MKRKIAVALAAAVVLAVVGGIAIQADEFTKKDQERWEKEYMSVVQKGRELWTSPAARHERRRLRPVPPERREHPPRDLPEVPAAARPRDRAARDDQLVHPAAARGQAPRPRQPGHGGARGLRRVRAARRGARPRQALTNGVSAAESPATVGSADALVPGRAMPAEPGGRRPSGCGQERVARQWATVSPLRRSAAVRSARAASRRGGARPPRRASGRRPGRAGALPPRASSPRSRTSPTACSGSTARCSPACASASRPRASRWATS